MGGLSDLVSDITPRGGTFADPLALFNTPGLEHETLSVLGIEQQQQLEELIRKLSGAAPRTFEGDVNVGLTELSELSLAGLENRALELSDPNFESELSRKETETLLKLLDFEGQQQGVNEFFDVNIRNPALESFREDVLPSIGRDFGGADFFGSERKSTDQRAQEELIDSLIRSRSEINFRSAEASKNRAIQALGISSGRETARTQEKLGIFGAGMEESALAERNISRQFEQFLAEAGLEDAQIKQLLQSLALPQIENIVSVPQGNDAGALVGAVASLFAG